MTTDNTTQHSKIDEQTLVQPNKNHQTAKSSSSILKKNHKILSIIAMQIMIIFFMFVFLTVYAWLHGIPAGFSTVGINDIEEYNKQVAEFRFIGTSTDNLEPSFYSVWLEVFVWSFFGIMARELYYLTMVGVRNRPFEILKAINKIIGETAMGVAIAIAVISFLRAAQLSIGNLDLTLKTASIEFIGASAFILGFYHEDTRRLLGSFRKQVANTDQKELEQGDDGEQED